MTPEINTWKEYDQIHFWPDNILLAKTGVHVLKLSFSFKMKDF